MYVFLSRSEWELEVYAYSDAGNSLCMFSQIKEHANFEGSK